MFLLICMYSNSLNSLKKRKPMLIWEIFNFSIIIHKTWIFLVPVKKKNLLINGQPSFSWKSHVKKCPHLRCCIKMRFDSGLENVETRETVSSEVVLGLWGR